MDIEEYRNYCLSKKVLTESFPFGKLPNVLVFKVGSKMFTATDITIFKSISIKCKPEDVVEMRENYSSVSYRPYMDKKHWNNVLMDGTIPDELIKTWIDTSYNLVLNKLPKKVKKEIENDYEK